MEKILKLLEEYGAVSKDMSSSHGDQHNWRILLAEAIFKQQSAQQYVQRTRPEQPPANCKCGAKDGRHAAWCN